MTLAPLLDPQAVAAAALDGLGDGVLVVAGGTVLVANGAAHRLTGHGPGELVGGPAPAGRDGAGPRRDARARAPRRRRRSRSARARCRAASPPCS